LSCGLYVARGFDAIHDNVATKQDGKNLRLKVKAEIDRIMIRLGT
jgi:hypothetical protein